MKIQKKNFNKNNLTNKMLLRFFIVVLYCGQIFGKTFENLSRDDSGICVDNDGGSVDSNGNSCDWYADTTRGSDNSLQCGFFDVYLGRLVYEFQASEMCCACGYSTVIDDTNEDDTNETSTGIMDTTTQEDTVLYYVDDGCHSEGSSPDDILGFYQSKSSYAFVRCCSTFGTSCFTISDCADSGDLVTYAEAVQKCATNGQRLCSKDELLEEKCCGTGGSCDNYGVWTSTSTIPDIPNIALCYDGVKNQDETDVDCGGVCDACPTCSDGILNQDETLVDCGGTICQECESCSDRGGSTRNGENTDLNGNDCYWYWNNQGQCGKYDCTFSDSRYKAIYGEQCEDYNLGKQICCDYFVSTVQCCACGGGDNVPDLCVNTDQGATDTTGNGCAFYEEGYILQGDTTGSNYIFCGEYDCLYADGRMCPNGYFAASEMCCVCGGGVISDEASYYVDDGCHSEGSNPDDYTGFYQVESSNAFVRCCSDDGTNCETISNCQDSDDLRNYLDAETECANNGMRLCTRDELLTEICCGTGGGCDSQLVWTSTTSTDSK